ncbi:MAG: FGGY-family carbohydrate kinase [Coleofasciculaceae cyanobacterium]
MNLYLGIDFGTSGARAVVIDEQETIKAETQSSFAVSEKNANLAANWQKTLFSLIERINLEIREKIKAVAINGTSSTVLLCNARGEPIEEPILYNDGRAIAVKEKLQAIAPPNHVALSTTSSFAKLLWLRENHQSSVENCYFLHQADWLAFLLHGKLGISDYHNALKLGYDTQNLCYPNWIQQLPALPKLPQVLAPGTPVGEVTPEISRNLGLPANCLVCTGTTDSIAAFLASGAKSPGEAVTSLGSTLVLKLLSNTHVEDSHYGVYRHRLGNLWLTGGASNTGGAVLRHFFSDAELEKISNQIDPQQESTLNYYPLLQPGERFPLNDPHLPPQLEPQPANSVEFLHGLLESIARIEARGYQLLQKLGATKLTRIYTAGGGAKNTTWITMRERHLQVPVSTSKQTAAAYGTALLAKRGAV